MQNSVNLLYTSVLLVFVLVLFACNKHYGYLSKVRVSKQEKSYSTAQQTNNKAVNNDVIEANDQGRLNIISASADTLSEIITINDYSIKPQFDQKYEQVLSKERIKPIKSKEPVRQKKPPMNYYAKWALIISLISLFGSILILPGTLAPLALFLGRKSLNEIRNNGERGKVAAVSAIIIGTILSTIIFFIFLDAFLTDFKIAWILFVLLLCLLIMLLNLLVYNTIKKSVKNPANADSPERPFKRQNVGIKTFLIILLTTLIFINMIILVFMRAFRG